MKHFPPKRKYKKNFKKYVKFQKPLYRQKLVYGNIGLRVLEFSKVSHYKLNALHKILTVMLQRKGQIWQKIYPMNPKTKKPLEVRMGKGKGNVEYWEQQIQPGIILFEITSNDLKLAYNGLFQIQKRLGLKSEIILKNDTL